jgi:hypothetical protein
LSRRRFARRRRGSSASRARLLRLRKVSEDGLPRSATARLFLRQRDKNKFAKPDDFLERMRLREEQTRKRREARASEWRSRALLAGGSHPAKPGWDDSPDVVVRVGASPEENRRREREREAERALLAARREALLEQMSAQKASPGSPAVGVEAIMSGMGFAKANKAYASEGKPGLKSSPSPGTGGGRRRKSLSPAAERQREADARRAAGLDPKFTRVVFSKPSFPGKKKSPKSDRTKSATNAPSELFGVARREGRRFASRGDAHAGHAGGPRVFARVRL